MRRVTKALLEKSIDSLVLAIDHFNRPWDQGRHEAALIFIDRSIELLMKAALVHRGYKIRESADSNTFGFEKCVNKCVSEAAPPILTDEEAIAARLLNGLRDAAQHYLVEVSEQQLYVYLQAGVTLVTDKLQAVFVHSLKDHLPDRVLPVSTKPPKDLASVVQAEFDQIADLVVPGSRRRLEATSRLRSIAVLENALLGDSTQPTERDLNRLIRKVKDGLSWKEIFPGVASLELSSEGTGLNVSIRLTKSEGTPVRLVKEGSEGAEYATVVAIKRVDELGFYSLGLHALAEHLDLTPPKALALIRHLQVQEEKEYFREVVIGRSRHRRYSPRALAFLRQMLPTVDMEEVWEANRPTPRRTERTRAGNR
jgi:hypothetical protein